LHKEKFHNLYSFTYPARSMNDSDERCIQNSSLKGRDHLGRPRRRWEDNIKMDLKEVGWESMDSIHLSQGPVEVSCERGNER
jgi:hypothetical protein